MMRFVLPNDDNTYSKSIGLIQSSSLYLELLTCVETGCHANASTGLIRESACNLKMINNSKHLEMSDSCQGKQLSYGIALTTKDTK